MAITYDWVIQRMDVYPSHEGQEDVVFFICWRLNGFDGDYSGTNYGSVSVTYKPENPFTPYENLTKDQVVNWVKDALGEEQVTNLELSIANQIEDAKNPKVISLPLPWSTT